MNIARSIGGVIAGYLIFGISLGILFREAGVDPHESAPVLFVVLSTLYGAFFAALGGYVAAWIAGRGALKHALALTVVIGAFALLSLVAMLGKGSIWSQLATICVIAPSALLGGRIRRSVVY